MRSAALFTRQVSRLPRWRRTVVDSDSCLLYTSDAADDLLCVDLGGRRILKKKTEQSHLQLSHVES